MLQKLSQSQQTQARPADARPYVVDLAIAALAARQHGLVTRRQLLDLGLGKSAIVYRLEVGRLHRYQRGVYAVGHRPVSRYADAMGAVLACAPDAILSHGSAAALWQIQREWRQPLEITAPRTRRSRRNVRVHSSRTLTRRDMTVHFGIPVTTPARTLLDNADRLSDAALARAINDLRLARHLWRADLTELLDRTPTGRATNRLRAHVADPRRAPTRSELEDEFLVFAKRHGLPATKVNQHVAGHEVDIWFPEHRLVIELDGYETHQEREQFEDDRDRDADALVAGIATVRVTRRRLRGKPEREAARLLAILALRAS